VGKPDLIFAGVPNQYVRRYVHDTIERLKPERVVIPCAGAFALAVAARGAGIAASNIVCGDITLYSTVLGCYASGGDMPIVAKNGWDWLNGFMLDDMLGKVAAVILAIRMLQYDRPALHYQTRRRELITNATRYIMQIRETTARAMEPLGGIRYDARDLWETIGEFRDDTGALILVDPPWYKLGYTRMFKGIDDVFDWAKPTVPEFDPADAPRLIEYLGEAPARTLVFYGVPTNRSVDVRAEFGGDWVPVFCDKPKVSGGSVATWLMANKATGLREIFTRHDIEPHERGKYKLFEGEILPTMKLQVVNEKQSQVQYYRDLLVHRLGLINSELYQVVLLDGMLLACIGFHVGTMRTSAQYGVAKLTFAFNVHNERYPKLNKLVLMCAVSSWLWEPYLKDIEEMPTKVQTTMLTPYPETKIARGVMKMTARQKHGDGLYKLTYYGDIVYRTAEETLKLWLEKYAT
jgi:hypothetical protein